MSTSIYWVHYRKENDSGAYQERRAKAGTLMGLASLLNEITAAGGQIVSVGATAPRPLTAKERQVVQALTRGQVKIP
jgi:hypothetical protein